MSGLEWTAEQQLLAVLTVAFCVVGAVWHWRHLRVAPDPWDGQLTEDAEDGEAPADGEMPAESGTVCTACLESNPAHADFCCRCGNPMGATTAMDPLKRIWAQGWIYRQATSSPYRFLIVLGMWLIFAPGFFMLLVGVLLGGEQRGTVLPSLLLWLPLGAVSAAILLKVTANFIGERRGRES